MLREVVQVKQDPADEQSRWQAIKDQQYKGDLASAADAVKLSKLRREASLIEWEILGETLDADHRNASWYIHIRTKKSNISTLILSISIH